MQKQTGHKTVSMLEHYASHTIDGDIEKLRNAQIEVFGDMLSTSPVIQFNDKKLLDYVKTEYKG